MRFSVVDDLPGVEPFTVIHTETGGVIGWYNSKAFAEQVAKDADANAPADFTGYPNPFVKGATAAAAADPHRFCTEEFCRTPLHPGPCAKFHPPRVHRRERRTHAPSGRDVPHGDNGDDGFPAQVEARPYAGHDTFEDAAAATFSAYTRIQTMPADERRKRGAGWAAAIAEVQGFDGQGIVGTDEDIDQAIAAGGIEVWRGVRAGDYAQSGRLLDQLREGPVFHGLGIYGNGIYAGSDQEISREYADGTRFDAFEPSQTGGSVVRMALRPGARVIEYHDLGLAMQQWFDHEIALLHERQNSDPKFTLEDHRRASHRLRDFYTDPGSWAALMGYDAIYAHESPHTGDTTDPSLHWNILNRTALVISETHEEIPEGQLSRTRASERGE